MSDEIVPLGGVRDDVSIAQTEVPPIGVCLGTHICQ
jgi:hypothetical protein